MDALTGDVIGDPNELSTNEGKRAEEDNYLQEAANIDAALRSFSAVTQRAAKGGEGVERVTGQGLVFNPDPITSLATALTDNSPAVAFEPAYNEVNLLELAKFNNVVRLEGPWVAITDFEPPNTIPSTTADGVWTAKRGDNAFNDVMTYYHIDQSQRYIQSLGFTGIQARPIPADSDGMSGADNSHYVGPPIDRIAFGHGCVDDNEDADVILHEYGHAMTYHINPSWSGGDSRAIGEGFGDYWAETYSHSTPNGASFQADRVFEWDGTCPWGGRSVNVTGVQYDPDKNYGAHEGIGNGVQSDELWSTPLFQSFLELRGRDVPREEIDTIVLQSMFGLGAGFKMHDLAAAVVATAKQLHPQGVHSGIFQAQFEKLNILGPDGSVPTWPGGVDAAGAAVKR
ncbi:hypothetical protein [uncultured Jannaschia sp.]|uniref:hypothetical protein n=1 Tax=uncultured Jannaschia sp. TaxID=293347 RepID=UPI002624B7CE|nr:hypothetical protein [uncultured Jannaschia sp.]